LGGKRDGDTLAKTHRRILKSVCSPFQDHRATPNLLDFLQQSRKILLPSGRIPYQPYRGGRLLGGSACRPWPDFPLGPQARDHDEVWPRGGKGSMGSVGRKGEAGFSSSLAPLYGRPHIRGRVLGLPQEVLPGSGSSGLRAHPAAQPSGGRTALLRCFRCVIVIKPKNPDAAVWSVIRTLSSGRSSTLSDKIGESLTTHRRLTSYSRRSPHLASHRRNRVQAPDTAPKTHP
jgi:hypothetical protein